MVGVGNRFLVLGRAGMDLYADPPGCEIEHATQFVAALGGSAANIAVAIVRLGGEASLVSVVSDDAVGRYTHNQLKMYGVGTSHVSVVGGEARNSLAVVETRNENCQSVIYRNGAADFLLTDAHIRAVNFSRFDAMIVTGTALAIEPSRSTTLLAMALALEAGMSVILDVDYRPYSWVSIDEAAEVCMTAAMISDIVIANDVEFGVLSNGGDGLALAEKLATEAGKTVVYKKGEKGSITFTNHEHFNTPIYPVAPVKPTGAGDAFMGGFVTGLAQGLDLRACVNRGSAAAAIVVTRVGCAPACPTEDELAAFMQRNER